MTNVHAMPCIVIHLYIEQMTSSEVKGPPCYVCPYVKYCKCQGANVKVKFFITHSEDPGEDIYITVDSRQ